MMPKLVKTLPPLPPRPADANKGTFGRVLIIGGNDHMIGAPVLAGLAALRTGSGLVQIALPKAVLAAGLSICPELIGLPLGASGAGAKALQQAMEQSDAIVIGPGLGRSPRTAKLIQAALRLDTKVLLDADALNALATGQVWPRKSRGGGDVRGVKAQLVLTPHPGEMRRLTACFDDGALGDWSPDSKNKIPGDDASRLDIAIRCARHFNDATTLLKGHRTIVTDGRHRYRNTTGSPALAKAGSGDVLSGIIGSLLGQGMNPFEAACLGACLHGKAGEQAGESAGPRSAIARDVIDHIARALATVK